MSARDDQPPQRQSRWPRDSPVLGLTTRDRNQLSVEDQGVDVSRWRRGRLVEALPAYLGAAAGVVYLLFAFLAYTHYPATFSPQNNNWLSDLGNRDLNPQGANYYVWGCIATGAILLAFFLSLTTCRKTGSRIQNWLLALFKSRVEPQH
jgi:hypothetical protein